MLRWYIRGDTWHETRDTLMGKHFTVTQTCRFGEVAILNQKYFLKMSPKWNVSSTGENYREPWFYLLCKRGRVIPKWILWNYIFLEFVKIENDKMYIHFQFFFHIHFYPSSKATYLHLDPGPGQYSENKCSGLNTSTYFIPAIIFYAEEVVLRRPEIRSCWLTVSAEWDL